MAKYSSAWARPIQGVSQQSAQVRLPGQCTAQENCIPSVVRGLMKRWGSQHIADLGAALPDRTLFYFYNRGDAEQYFMAFPPNSTPLIWLSDGTKCGLSVESGANYVSVSDPKSHLSVTTISDYTFVASSDTTPRAASGSTPGVNNMAIISLQFADYGRTYSVTLDGQWTGSYLTPDGAEASQIKDVDTSVVAGRVLDSLLSNMLGKNVEGRGSGTAISRGEALSEALSMGYSIAQDSNTLLIRRTNGQMPKVTTTDGADGEDFIVVTHRVTAVDKLPTKAPEGYLVEVVGSGSNTDEDNYWLRASYNQGGNISWVETTGPGQSPGLDKSTMPHVLVRTGFSGGVPQFSLREAPWDDRKVGTDESNPMPSFIQDGVAIRAVGVFQNRLWMAAGESLIFSQSNYFFNLFRRTSRTLVDDQPVDVYADTDQVNYLADGCILDGDLILRSQNGQFMIRGDQVLTHENANLRAVSSYKSTLDANPVGSGNVVFLPFQYGITSGVRELYTDTYTDTKKARSISDHIREYVRGSVRLMSTSTNINTLFLLSDDRDTITTYDWQWEGTERVQSAWGKWVFLGANLRYVEFDRDTIYLLIERGGRLYLETLLAGDPDTTGLSFPLRLDRVHAVTATREGDVWSFTDPLPLASYMDRRVVRGPGCLEVGSSVQVLEGDTTRDVLSVESDEVTLYVGEAYEMVFIPTPPFIKDGSGAVIGTDKLTINRIYVNYDAIGEVSVRITNQWGSSREYSYNGRRLGQPENIIGFSLQGAGQFEVPIHQRSEDSEYRISSTHHVPFELRDLEWVGQFKQRGRRI